MNKAHKVDKEIKFLIMTESYICMIKMVSFTFL